MIHRPLIRRARKVVKEQFNPQIELLSPLLGTTVLRYERHIRRPRIAIRLGGVPLQLRTG
jgi:hypothetical protein